MKHNIINNSPNNKKIDNPTPKYLLKFDPIKHNWLEEVIKCEIPIIFSCGDCIKFEKYFNLKFYDEKLLFRVVKTNFLNDRGKSKNPIPYFMFLIKNVLIYQFSADNSEINELMEKVFEKIKEFTEKNKGNNYFICDSNSQNNNSQINYISSNNISNLQRKFSLSMPIIIPERSSIKD